MIQSQHIESLQTPIFITDIEKIQDNVRILNTVQERTGAKILLALKAFAQYSTFKYISRNQEGFLYGCCASSVHEAKLAFEEFKGEVHAYAAAFSKEEIKELLPIVDHIVFNSFYQLETLSPLILEHNNTSSKKIEIGLRINPEHSEGAREIYNPCSPTSRLGVRKKQFNPQLLANVSGLHFHTLCEQNADALERTLEAVENNFGQYFSFFKWLNLGGGHHITRSDYQIDLLCSLIEKLKKKYGLEIYLEPGEAIALNAGYFVATVLDIVEAEIPTAILDCSPACHMPDVLEMPYVPHIVNGTIHPDMEPLNKNTFRLAGKSCLAGDVIGIYDFSTPLERGQKIIFKDMAIYSMVKTNTFNGIQLPAIATLKNNTVHIHKNFTYADFKDRL